MKARLTFAGAALASAALASLLVAGCGGSSDDDASDDATASLSAEVASYDLAVGSDERLLVGAFGAGLTFLSYGTVELELAHEGTVVSTHQAGFVPIPGQDTPAGGPPRVPTLTRPSEGRGVYEALDVEFDTPGFWDVTLSAEVDGEVLEATTTFEVAAQHSVVTPGEFVALTANPLPGDVGVSPSAIDSRASADGTIPDPLLHTATVADFVAAEEPVLVLVSTPMFCVSRFCGPITDMIETLADEHAADLGFVHLEVWEDFDSNTLSDAAAQWIWPGQQGDPAEPWVFLVGSDGRLIRRWDNVVSATELEAEIEALGGV